MSEPSATHEARETQALAALLAVADQVMALGMGMAKGLRPSDVADAIDLVRAGRHRVELRVAVLGNPARIAAYLVAPDGEPDVMLFSYDLQIPAPATLN